MPNQFLDYFIKFDKYNYLDQGSRSQSSYSSCPKL